jgi:hypothetical protein
VLPFLGDSYPYEAHGKVAVCLSVCLYNLRAAAKFSINWILENFTNNRQTISVSVSLANSEDQFTLRPTCVCVCECVSVCTSALCKQIGMYALCTCTVPVTLSFNVLYVGSEGTANHQEHQIFRGLNAP